MNRGPSLPTLTLLSLAFLFSGALLFAGGAGESSGTAPSGSRDSSRTDQASPEGQEEDISVFVSVLPQTYFVERIGGETVEVSALVPPGRGPATYEPTPRQVTALAGADVYFRIGVPFEARFIPRLEENLPALRVVDSTRNVDKRYFVDDEDHDHAGEDHDREDDDGEDHEDEDHHAGDEDHHGGDEDHHGEDEDHHGEDREGEGADHGEDPHESDREAEHEDEHDHAGAPDPHVWLGPEEVIAQLEVIRDTLIGINPDAADLYRGNYTIFVEEIRALKLELAEYLAPLEGETFYVYHPSFGYFGDAFGLEQVAIETGGDEPTPAQLRRIIDRARTEGVNVIFVQPQFSQNAARRVAEAIDGAVISVNHLNPDWFEMMRTIATALKEGLQ